MDTNQQGPPKEPTVVRHCAYCLVEGSDFKTCGKCHRRAYCSKECQALDWKVGSKDKEKGGVGQGHKKWCRIPYGEEDLDWAVVPLKGKGVGLQALRDIPPLFRILVEGWLTKEDVVENANFAKLVPEGGTTDVKFVMNAIAGDKVSAVGLRLSRANHNCDGNASYATDDDAKVLIKAGDEICISYIRRNDIAQQLVQKDRRTPQRVRNTLMAQWGIVCPEDCFCYDPKVQTLIDKCFSLDKKYERSAQLFRPAEAFEALEEIIQLMLTAKCTPNMICRVWGWILEAAECSPTLTPIGLKYAEMIRDFNGKIYHPSMKYVNDSAAKVERLKQGLIFHSQ